MDATKLGNTDLSSRERETVCKYSDEIAGKHDDIRAMISIKKMNCKFVRLLKNENTTMLV